jgi:hypothetical protein
MACLGCDKGYDIRFANYHTRAVDTALIGTKILFTSVEAQTVTDYKPISRGQYHVRIVTKAGKVYTAGIFIPGQGSGHRTLQIDGTGQVSYLEQ